MTSDQLTVATAAAYAARFGGDTLHAYHVLAQQADALLAVACAAEAWGAAQAACFAAPLDDDAQAAADAAHDVLRAAVARWMGVKG